MYFNLFCSALRRHHYRLPAPSTLTEYQRLLSLLDLQLPELGNVKGPQVVKPPQGRFRPLGKAELEFSNLPCPSGDRLASKSVDKGVCKTPDRAGRPTYQFLFPAKVDLIDLGPSVRCQVDTS